MNTMKKVRQILTPRRHKSEERKRLSSAPSRYDQISSAQNRLPISSETKQAIPSRGRPPTPSHHDRISLAQERLPSQTQTPLRQQSRGRPFTPVSRPNSTLSNSEHSLLRPPSSHSTRPYSSQSTRPSSSQCDKDQVALNLFIELAKCALNQQRKQDQDLRISVDAIVERLVEILQYFETSSDKDAVSKSIKIDHAYWQRDQEKLLVMERMKRNRVARKKYAGGANTDVETQRDLLTEGPSSIPTTESDMIVLLKDELLSLKNQLNNESNQYQSKLDEMNQQIVVYKAKNDLLEGELQETKEAYQALEEENSALKQMESTKAAATLDADELLEQQPDDTVDNPTLGSKTARPAYSTAVPPPPVVSSIVPPANGGNSSALSGGNNEKTIGDRDMESNIPSSGASLESSKVALQVNPPTVDEVCRATDNLDVSSTNEDEADDGDATGSENDIVSNVRRAPTTIIKHRSPPQVAPLKEVVYVDSVSRVQEEVDDDSALSGAANTGMALDHPHDMASIGSSNFDGGGELDSNTTLSRSDHASQQDELGDDQSEDDLSDHDTDSNKNSTSDSESDSSASSSGEENNEESASSTNESIPTDAVYVNVAKQHPRPPEAEQNAVEEANNAQQLLQDDDRQLLHDDGNDTEDDSRIDFDDRNDGDDQEQDGDSDEEDDQASRESFDGHDNASDDEAEADNVEDDIETMLLDTSGVPSVNNQRPCSAPFFGKDTLGDLSVNNERPGSAPCLGNAPSPHALPERGQQGLDTMEKHKEALRNKERRCEIQCQNCFGVSVGRPGGKGNPRCYRCTGRYQWEDTRELTSDEEIEASWMKRFREAVELPQNVLQYLQQR